MRKKKVRNYKQMHLCIFFLTCTSIQNRAQSRNHWCNYKSSIMSFFHTFNNTWFSSLSFHSFFSHESNKKWNNFILFFIVCSMQSAIFIYFNTFNIFSLSQYVLFIPFFLFECLFYIHFVHRYVTEYIRRQH